MNHVLQRPIVTARTSNTLKALVFSVSAIVLLGLATSTSAGQPDSAEAVTTRPSNSKPKAPVASPAEIPTEDLVFLGADHPIFVRLFASIDGKEIRTARADRVAKTLAELDDNHDGVIDQAERTAHPRAFRSLGVPEKWTNLLPLVDRNPQDEKISSDEIVQFLADRFGPTVTLASRVRRGNQAVELFDLIDADHDQRLTDAELKEMPVRLHKLDADGDDAFSVVEVEPFRNPFGGGVPTGAVTPEDLPWVIAKSAAERLLTRFDVAPKDQALSARELGQPEASIATADVDHSGGLSLAELQKWLPTVTPQYALITSAFKRKAGRTELSWVDYTSTTDGPAKPRRETAKNLEVKLADQPFQLQMTSTARGLESDTINFYRNQFRRADVDKNKYLDKTEFNALGSLGAGFEMLDVDDNGQIYEPELVDYLSLETASEQSRVILSVDRNEQSLFSLLDRNSDRRLTPREYMSTFDRWQSFDHDGDRILNRSELSGRMRMTVELPKPKLFQPNLFQSNQMSGDPLIKNQADGPAWFQGMDRNKDGDVSRREFLGTEVQFRKWDRNGDGLISKDEAS
ncbi:MAG: hypothetical protein JWM11_4692 [Planctomycetaceae bacterium]|nr:hypothetical protein [Planctomycetaceae bacterium]